MQKRSNGKNVKLISTVIKKSKIKTWTGKKSLYNLVEKILLEESVSKKSDGKIK